MSRFQSRMSEFQAERWSIEELKSHKNPYQYLREGIPYYMTKKEACEAIAAIVECTTQSAAYSYQERELLVTTIRIIAEKLAAGGFFTDEEIAEIEKEEKALQQA